METSERDEELSEEGYEELAWQRLGQESERYAEAEVMTPEQWRLCTDRVNADGVEAGLQYMRNMYLHALSAVNRTRYGNVDYRTGAKTHGNVWAWSGFDVQDWHALSLEIDRSPELMAERVKANLKDGGLVVDLGCGTGRATLPLLKEFPNTNVLGLDSSSKMLDKFSREADRLGVEGRAYANYVNLEGLEDYHGRDSLGGLEEQADHVVSNGVLYYLNLRDLLSVFAFAKGILKEGGRFDFSLPVQEGGVNELTLSDGRVVNREWLVASNRLTYLYSFMGIESLLGAVGLELESTTREFVHREPGCRHDVNYTFFTARKPIKG